MNFDYVGSKLKIKPAAAHMRYSRLKRAVFSGENSVSKGDARKSAMDGESP